MYRCLYDTRCNIRQLDILRLIDTGRFDITEYAKQSCFSRNGVHVQLSMLRRKGLITGSSVRMDFALTLAGQAVVQAVRQMWT